MSYNYVFIHNPKTGGDTVTALLNIEKTHKYIYLRKDEILNKESLYLIYNYFKKDFELFDYKI